MRIVILGAGDSGRFLAKNLSTTQHSISVIDESERLIANLSDTLDVATVCGNGVEASVLAEANVAEADLFIGLTSDDNANMLAASVAKSIGAQKTIARVRVRTQNSQWLFNYGEHFGIDYLFSSERLTAIELSKFILNADQPTLQQLGKGKITVQQVTASSASSLLGAPLRELPLPDQARVAAVRRDGETRIPGGDDALEAGDSVTIFGGRKEAQQLAAQLRPEASRQEKKRVTIYGGRDYGFALALLLNSADFQTRVIEADRALCESLAKTLPEAVVIEGDGRSAQLLREEQVENTDFFIGASLSDEDNLMACLQAKRLGVAHAIPVIHSGDNSSVIDGNRQRLGFLATVSPRQVTMSDLVRFVEADEFHAVGALSDSVELVQFTVHRDAKVAGKPVHEIKWPKACSLVALLRNEEAIVPSGKATVRAGDSVYAVVLPQAKGRLLRLLRKT